MNRRIVYAAVAGALAAAVGAKATEVPATTVIRPHPSCKPPMLDGRERRRGKGERRREPRYGSRR
jgi:hypothetical protein